MVLNFPTEKKLKQRIIELQSPEALNLSINELEAWAVKALRDARS